MPRAVHLLTVLGLAVGAVSIAAQADSAGSEFGVWRDAVATHAPGQRDAPLVRIAQWNGRDLDEVSGPLSRLGPEQRTPLIERALVLHADIATLNRTSGGYTLPPAPGSTTLFADGKSVGQMARTFHWDFARRLIDRLPRDEARIRIGHRFYRAAAAVLQRWGEFPELEPHLAAWRRSLGENAWLLLYEGTLHQAYAGPRVQEFAAEQRRNADRLPLAAVASPQRLQARGADVFPDAGRSLAAAERLFRRALALDPSLAEARIRLAHVLVDRGRPADAQVQLAAIDAPLPSLLDYYAALIAGRAARAGGDLAAAARAFEHAAALYPAAAAPRYGLSEVAMARGDRTAALAFVAAAQSARVEANEPWWWLDRAHVPSASDLMIELRTSAPR